MRLITLIIQFLLGLIATVAIALTAWSLNTSVELSRRVVVLEEQIKMLREQTREISCELEKISSDDKRDQMLEAKFSRFWRLHTWAREEISALKHKCELGEVKWPDLGDRP